MSESCAKPTCAADDCGKPAKATGLCAMHYWRVRKHGTLDLPARQKTSLSDAFWVKVERREPDECWEWQAYRDKRGYGHLRYDGRLHLAHRIAWSLTNGPIPEGLGVLHHCDNPSCCNPTHLYVGTAADNSADMVRRNRLRPAYGSLSVRAKMTEADVLEIRRLRAEGATVPAIAQMYGKHHNHIANIVYRRRWRHI